ncbi:hypothetical protein MKW92_021309 [Papaver armeniacum]|nr:hypothetical protein MKW92_021309 [Papaver armeniacum]
MPSRVAQIRLVSGHPEVYEPCDDSFALVDALLADQENLVEHQPMFCLEVSCGSGLKATARESGGSAQLRPEDSAASVSYFATDIHPHAVRVTSETLKAHTVHAEVLCDNIAASGLGKRLWGKVDVMVVNPHMYQIQKMS